MPHVFTIRQIATSVFEMHTMYVTYMYVQCHVMYTYVPTTDIDPPLPD